MPDVYDPILTVDGRPLGLIYGSGTFYVTSDASTESYSVVFNAICTESGSTYVVNTESVDGIETVTNRIMLRTMYSPVTDIRVTTSGITVNIMYQNESIAIDVLPRNGLPRDECEDVSGELVYTNSRLSYNNRTVSNINALYRVDEVRLARYPGMLPTSSSPPSTDTGPLFTCIDFDTMVAVYTKDSRFIDMFRNEYVALRNLLRAPTIADPGTTPGRVTVTNEEFQIGTTPIEVLEEINQIWLRCRLSSAGFPSEITYTWTKDNQTIVSNNVNYLIVDDLLIIKNTEDPADEGMYTCTARNQFSSDTATTSLMVVQESPAPSPSPPPTDPPAVPMWFAHAFSGVSILLILSHFKLFPFL